MSSFFWTPERIRFLEDAGDDSGYYDALASLLKQMLPSDATVLDVGGGTGRLALALSAHCRSVTSLDHSLLATETARAHADTVSNMDAVCADAHSYLPQKRYDAAVFHYYGRMEDVLAFLERTGILHAFVIKRRIAVHRFSVSSHKTRFESLNEAERILKERGIAYTRTDGVLPFGQPFRSEADAVRFFQTYSRDAHPQTISFSDIAPRLVRRDDPVFPLFLPEEKRFAILILSKKEALS